MGEGTFVDHATRPLPYINEGQDQANQVLNPSIKNTRFLYLKTDVTLICAVAVLIGFGLLMLYSASPQFAWLNDVPSDYYLRSQITMVLLGTGIMLFMALAPVRYQWLKWGRSVLSVPVVIMAVTLFFLIWVKFGGVETFGSQRSLFGGSVRPSELAKLAIILYLSVWLEKRKDNLNKFWYGLAPVGFITGLLAFLIFLQPDISAAITVFALGMMLFFLAGGNVKNLAFLFLFGGFVVFLYILIPTETGNDRITTWIAGLQDLNHAHPHVKHAIWAALKGSLLGVGIGNGTAIYTGLPVSISDSIFAIIIEETGLIGTLLITSCYFLIVFRALRIARQAPDMLGALLAAGIGLWIGIEALVNISVMIGLLPQTGSALPLISHGGTNMIITLTGVGIILNVARANQVIQEKVEPGRSFGQVVNLCRRDRWRSVPRFVRPASTHRR